MMSRQYGEFKCPYCDYICFEKKKLSGHIGGAHRRNTTKDKQPVCKFCNKKLIEGKNWAKWAIKQRNLICVTCKRKQNRKSYRNRLNKQSSTRSNKLSTIKEKLKNVHTNS